MLNALAQSHCTDAFGRHDERLYVLNRCIECPRVVGAHDRPV